MLQGISDIVLRISCSSMIHCSSINSLTCMIVWSIRLATGLSLDTSFVSLGQNWDVNSLLYKVLLSQTHILFECIPSSLSGCHCNGGLCVASSDVLNMLRCKSFRLWVKPLMFGGLEQTFWECWLLVLMDNDWRHGGRENMFACSLMSAVVFIVWINFLVVYFYLFFFNPTNLPPRWSCCNLPAVVFSTASYYKKLNST